MVLYPAVSLVSINPEDAYDRSARYAFALAQGRLSLLLALEIASPGRSATNRDGPARTDPTDEHREPTLGRATHPRRPALPLLAHRVFSCGAEFGRYRGIAGMAGLAAASTRSRMTLTRRWTFCRIFGLDGRESYRELRLKPLCCPHRLSRGIAPHEREYPRRNDRF
jgi:hypothetical protein